MEEKVDKQPNTTLLAKHILYELTKHGFVSFKECTLAETDAEIERARQVIVAVLENRKANGKT
jgi:hypothetical protein